MSTNLHDRATTQQGLLEGSASAVTDALADARTALQGDDASAGLLVDLDTTRVLLDENHANQITARAALAAVASPADAETHEDALRELQITEAALAVELRHLETKVAEQRELVKRLGELASRTEAGVVAGAARVDEAKLVTDRTTVLRDRFTSLGSSVRDAAAGVLVGAEFAAADGRLDALIDGDLRQRIEERFAEAQALAARAGASAARADARAAGLVLLTAPLDAAVAAGKARHAAAESALADYLAGATGRLEWAEQMLAKVTAHPDLSALQDDALDPANHPNLTDAKDHETALAVALDNLAADRVPLDEVLLDQLVADPDDTVAIDDARDDLAVETSVAAARAAYTAADKRALDEWEVEMPASLWQAVEDLAAAKLALDELADNAARTALLTELGGAEDAFAAALTAREVNVRSVWAIELERAQRAAMLVALDRTAADRQRHYVRGDGPGGRSSAEL